MYIADFHGFYLSLSVEIRLNLRYPRSMHPAKKGTLFSLDYTLKYHGDVKKVDLPKIDRKNQAMIKRAIEERLTVQPEIFGKPLQRTLKGYWKLRAGEYRIVYKIIGKSIHILAIMHRKAVYRRVVERIEH